MADPTEVEEQNQEHGDSQVLKDLRAKAKRVEDAEERANKAERDLAFSRAKLDHLSEKQVKALLLSHEGEITADAIKATADELGFVAAKAETAETVVDPEQKQRTEELGHLNRFAGAPAPEGAADPNVALLKGIEEFDGDYQEFQAYVLANASSILPPRS